MTPFEALTVREQLSNIKQMDKVIDILLGKTDKDFTTFLKMLRDFNNTVWAEELEKRAEQFKEEGMYVCVGRRVPRGTHPHGAMHLPCWFLCGYACLCVRACVCVHACVMEYVVWYLLNSTYHMLFDCCAYVHILCKVACRKFYLFEY